MGQGRWISPALRRFAPVAGDGLPEGPWSVHRSVLGEKPEGELVRGRIPELP